MIIEIVGFPIKQSDFPVHYVANYQRVPHMFSKTSSVHDDVRATVCRSERVAGRESGRQGPAAWEISQAGFMTFLEGEHMV